MSLNPCFSGWCSLTMEPTKLNTMVLYVLILVLVDDVLWQKLNQTYQADADVLILVIVDVALLLVIIGLGGSC